jgi:hypothetical protein
MELPSVQLDEGQIADSLQAIQKSIFRIENKS